MKVLILHAGDPGSNRGGGGAHAMYRLHLGLRNAGIDSKILCVAKGIESPHIIKHSPSRNAARAEYYLGMMTSRLGLNDIHLLGSFEIKKYQEYLDADIINFHGTHGAFSYLAFPSLTESKPGVFTLHDIWPFTGHCAVSYDCERWKIGCGQCPYPETHPSVKRDNTRLEWKLKNWVYRRSNLNIVTLCNRVTAQAKQSMLSRFPIHQIPNGVDTEVYRPLDPAQCRALLGIPYNKKVLMIAALRLNQTHKGSNLLVESLRSLPDSLKSEVILLLLGNNGETITRAVDLQTIELGYVSSDRLKVICYSAADVFVHPTRADNLPLVLQESMACGTPMVSFAVGGVPDLVRPGITGYLAEPKNPQDLRDGIIQLLDDNVLRHKMGQQCRDIAENEYNLDLQVDRYIELYRRVLKGKITQPTDNLIFQPDVARGA